VHAVAGHAIELQLVHLEHGHGAVSCETHRFAQALIVGGAFRNIQCGCRDPGVQALQDRVATHHQFSLFPLVTALLPTLSLLFALLGRVVGAVLCLGGRTLAPQATSDLAATTLLGALLVCLAHTAVAAVISCHGE